VIATSDTFSLASDEAPLGAHVEKVQEKPLVNVWGQSVKTPWSGCQVGVQGSHAADQRGQLGSRQRQPVVGRC
jgi:hypothetical protein